MAPPRRDPVLVYKAQRRSREDRMTKAGPIELTFDTEHKMTGLEIITSLYAANECA
jgi:hypothetical protein